MRYLSSTVDVAKRTGLALNTLNRYVASGLVWGPWLKQNGSGSPMQWRPVDEAAATVVAQLREGGPGSPESRALARLAGVAVYAWHGRAPYVVVALPNVVEPAFAASEVATIADDLRLEGVPVATVVALPDTTPLV